MALVPVLCCGGLGLVGFIGARKNASKTVPTVAEYLLLAPPPKTAFPELGVPARTLPSGVEAYSVRIDAPGNTAGHHMQMHVLLPPGEHENASLPCVLVAPAGTPMIHGVRLTESIDYVDEVLPYAEAGMVAIFYSIDGGLPDSVNENNEQQVMTAATKAYPFFTASGAGVVNGRNALEYAIAKIPSVDPNRIYSAGHSSAGCLSLLLAAHEPRIKRCVAYAAAYDLEVRMEDMTSNFLMQQMFPGIAGFIRQTSPIKNVGRFTQPIFVFHAVDDGNVPIGDALRFRQEMEAAGKELTFEQVPNGGHYMSMINQGIPMAIQWLKSS